MTVVTVETAQARLEAATERARRIAKDVELDLAKEIERQTIFVSQQQPGYERQLVSTEVKRDERALRELEEAVAEVEGLITHRQTAILEAERAIEAGRAGVASLADLERLEASEEDLRGACRDLARLTTLLENAQRLVPLVVEALGIKVQAAATALRRLGVERVRARRAALRDELARARSAADDLGEVADLLRRMEERCGRALPVPSVSWHGADHVAEPEHVEPEIPEPSKNQVPA